MQAANRLIFASRVFLVQRKKKIPHSNLFWKNIGSCVHGVSNAHTAYIWVFLVTSCTMVFVRLPK